MSASRQSGLVMLMMVVAVVIQLTLWTSVAGISESSGWLADSHLTIDKHRKSDVFFSITVPPKVEPHSVDIQVRLLRHRFAFGCKFDDELLREGSQKRLDLFVNLFNWAAVTDFDLNEKDNGKNNPSKPHHCETIDNLHKKGIKLWLQPFMKNAVKGPPNPAELPEPIKYLLNVTKGKVDILDLQSMFLPGQDDPQTTASLFRLIRSLNPDIKLFLSESSPKPDEFDDLNGTFFNAETGISGIGIKEHLKSDVTHDTIQARLDRFRDSGLDVFVSEFDVHSPSEVKRADLFEDAMRAYFAHPTVQGVILTELQDDASRNLVDGGDLKLTEEGERYVCLTQKEWHTDQIFNMAHGTNFTMRGFQGDYEVIVRKNTVPMQQETFTLGKDSTTVAFEVTEDSSSITTHDKHDFVPKCISHRSLNSYGKATSTSKDSTITCSDHVSEASEAEAKVTCPEGMVMTSCSGFKNVNGALKWTGERITVTDGVATCTAVTQANTLLGDVKVFARCCGGTNLTCDYREAGPSSPFDGAMAESVCHISQKAMGCTAYNQNSHLKGAYPSPDLTSCFAENGSPWSKDPKLQTGVVSGVVCCSRPTGMQCHQVKSPESKSGLTARITCPEGEILTGCHLEAADGSQAGAHAISGPEDSTYCKAEVGEHLRTPVKATAICCSP